jgi:serine/threonine-protein kinase
LLRSPGGSVVAGCASGGAFLASWTAAHGYRVHDVRPGPASAVRIEFRAEESDIRVTVSCVGGVPQADVRQHGEDLRPVTPPGTS